MAMRKVYQSRYKAYSVNIFQTEERIGGMPGGRGRVLDPKTVTVQFRRGRYMLRPEGGLPVAEVQKLLERPECGFSSVPKQGMFWRYTRAVADLDALKALTIHTTAMMASDPDTFDPSALIHAAAAVGANQGTADGKVVAANVPREIPLSETPKPPKTGPSVVDGIRDTATPTAEAAIVANL